ncbi:MAG: hypothetical protein QOK47_391, partial [Actinomycetota bacterium]|nr:hypothetical protein [Actinomycetota bacterium]
MRKLGTAILGILLLTGAPAAGQTVGASAEQTFEASANWVVARTDNSARYHFINAYKSVDPIGATNTVADFGVVRCGIGSDGRVIITSCGVTTRIVFLRP